MALHETNDAGRRRAPVRLDLNLLVVFEAVWRERHVARAAEALALSQPAASHALARLRRLVGDPLFERAPGGVRPTPRAEAMWPEVATALAHARSALGGAADPTRLGRRLRLGMTGNVALTLLPGAVRRLREAAPDLDVGVVPVDRLRAPDMLARGRIDAVAGSWAGPRGPELRRARLYEERLVLAARAGHPLLDGPLDAVRFAAAPQVAVAPSGDPAGPVDRTLAGLGLARRVALVVETYALALEAVAVSDLVAVLAEGPVRRLGARLGVGARPLPVALDPLVVDLVAPASSRTLHDWLVDLLRPDPAA
ncbi:MAG: LysR family transcriptional regulator [Paracoccaceae bacterium]